MVRVSHQDDVVREVTIATSQRLRAERTARGWSQEVLARRAGVSAGMVLQIERGRTNPSLGLLVRLTEALGITLASLVEVAPVTTSVVRSREDALELWTDGAGSTGRMRLSVPGPDQLELWEWSLRPGAHYQSEAHAPGTVEMVLVHSGVLDLRMPEARHRLLPGDAIAFPADVEHRYASASDETTDFLHLHQEPRPASA